MNTIYQTLDSVANDPDRMLATLTDHLRTQRRPMELFEAIKMQTRVSLGLPMIATDLEPPRPDEIEQQLESGMLAACREAGVMLIEDGKINQGWMYLRPTGDLATAKQLLAATKITDENYDEMVQVLLHEGVDIRRGLTAVLNRQGICNSITLHEQTMAQRSKRDRRDAAETLVDFFYAELCEAVRGDIARRSAPAAADETLLQMIQSRPELLSGGGYHSDTTHIASIVQIASVCDTESHIRKAWELTQYGRRLNQQFQYPGEEPFRDFYPAYGAFYAALLGEDVEAGISYFRRKASGMDPAQTGTAAIETYVDLLDRTGHPVAAIKAAISLVPAAVPAQRIVPLLLEIAGRADQNATHNIENDENPYQPIAEYCQSRGDLLGYAAALSHAAALNHGAALSHAGTQTPAAS